MHCSVQFWSHVDGTSVKRRVFTARPQLLAMQTAVIARAILSVSPSVRLSLRPSHSGVLYRRMKIRYCGIQHLVGQSF